MLMKIAGMLVLVLLSQYAAADLLDGAGKQGKTGVLARIHLTNGVTVTFTGSSCPTRRQQALPTKAYYVYSQFNPENSSGPRPQYERKDGCWYKFSGAEEVLVSWSVVEIGKDPEIFPIEWLQ